jgi:hypothetical protein
MLKIEVRIPSNNGVKKDAKDIGWQRSFPAQDISQRLEDSERSMQKQAIAQVLGAIFNEN